MVKFLQVLKFCAHC